MQDIARSVGVTAPALYYHHPNKEDILVTALNLVMEELIARARLAVEDAGDDADRQLQFVVESIALLLAWQPELGMLEDDLRYLSPENRRRQAAVRDELEAIVTAVVVRGSESGAFRILDLDETVRAILGMLQWIPRWYSRDGELTAEQVARRYAELALRLVGRMD